MKVEDGLFFGVVKNTGKAVFEISNAFTKITN
jgi:hypothetical protein